MSEKKKPTGGKAMDELMRKLIQVPHKELAQAKRERAKKLKQKK